MKSLIDSQMLELELEVIKTGGLIKDFLNMLEQFFERKLPEHEDRAKNYYDTVNMGCASIENRCVKLLIHMQPVARDLRRIKAIIDVVTDFGRIVDQALHVVRIGLDYDKASKVKLMAAQSFKMVDTAIRSFVRNDKESAQTLDSEDDSVDKMFLSIKQDLIARIRSGASANDDWIIDCLLTIKYIERIADHAVNIAKAVLR